MEILKELKDHLSMINVNYPTLRDKINDFIETHRPRRARASVYIKSNVDAKLIDENGKVIRHVKGHNVITTTGLLALTNLLQYGSTLAATGPGKIYSIGLGSQDSVTAFTPIAGTTAGVNPATTHPTNPVIHVFGTWAASPEILGIKQVFLYITPYNSSTVVEFAIYSFGATAWTKPLNVSLVIDWTFTFSST